MFNSMEEQVLDWASRMTPRKIFKKWSIGGMDIFAAFEKMGNEKVASETVDFKNILS